MVWVPVRVSVIEAEGDAEGVDVEEVVGVAVGLAVAVCVSVRVSVAEAEGEDDSMIVDEGVDVGVAEGLAAKTNMPVHFNGRWHPIMEDVAQ